MLHNSILLSSSALENCWFIRACSSYSPISVAHKCQRNKAMASLVAISSWWAAVVDSDRIIWCSQIRPISSEEQVQCLVLALIFSGTPYAFLYHCRSSCNMFVSVIIRTFISLLFLALQESNVLIAANSQGTIKVISSFCKQYRVLSVCKHRAENIWAIEKLCSYILSYILLFFYSGIFIYLFINLLFIII